MDPTKIINPFDQLNHLFEMSLKISTATQSNGSSSGPSSEDMCEERDLVELMQNVNLDEQMQQQRPNHANVRPLSTLMQSPRSIQDFCKFSWMLPLNINTSQLMTSLNPQNNNYLNAMVELIQNRPHNPKFAFVSIYPHTENLVANCDIEQGQTIIEIPEHFMLGSSQTSNTAFKKYLLWLSVQLLHGKAILKPSSSINVQNFIYHLRKVQTFGIPVYIFEKKFIEKIISYSFSNSKTDAVEWLYFKLLPQNLDYHPIKEWEAIRSFHREVAHSLQKLQYEFIEEYKLIKQLVDGEFIMDDFTFRHFLKASVQDGMDIYEQYVRLFTPKNYVWTKLCEKTRVFEFNSSDCLENNYILGDAAQIDIKKKLVPFLDLLHHSSSSNNLSWYYSPIKNSIIIKAETAIKKGDLLYICYKKMSMQTCYIEYGFVDAKELSHVDMSLIISIEMIEWIANELFEKKIKKRFMSFLYRYLQEHQLLAEVRIYDYIADCYEDHLTKKQLVLEDIIDAYTQLTLLLLNKHDPQFLKRLYLQRETPMKIKMRKIVVRLIVASLRANISQRREKLQKIEKNLKKMQIHEQANQSNISALGIQEERHEQYRRFYQKQYQGKFNSLYHATAVKTILATEMKILQKILSLYLKNQNT